MENPNPNINPGGEVLAPWDPMNMNNPNNMDPTQAAAWRERERRQRTIRLLMMFLLMLLLMDSEDQAGRKRNEPRHRKSQQSSRLSSSVFGARLAQEAKLQKLTQKHPRYRALMDKNRGKNIPLEVLHWAEQQAEFVKDEFVVTSKETLEERDPDEDTKVFHYPWNATGFYRGEWIRDVEKYVENVDGEVDVRNPTEEFAKTAETTTARKMESKSEEPNADATTEGGIPTQYLDAVALESEILQVMKERKRGIGVVLLPPGKEVILRFDHSNFTSADLRRGGPGHYFIRSPASSNLAATKDSSSSHNKDDFIGDGPVSAGGVPNPSTETSKVTLTKGSGRAAFQLFSRSIPAMQEISLVDGFLKLYDSNMPGYSTHKDILLRVRGVLIHAIGRMSLISNAGLGRSVLVLDDFSERDSERGTADDDTKETALGHRHRRLMDALAKLKEAPDHSGTHIKQVRDDALAVYGSDEALGKNSKQFKFQSILAEEAHHIKTVFDSEEDPEDTVALEGTRPGKGEDDDGATSLKTSTERRTMAVEQQVSDKKEMTDNRYKQDAKDFEHHEPSSITTVNEQEIVVGPGKFKWSEVLIPYPFVLDDEEEAIRKTKTPAARKMPPREQLLERNAGICEFEVVVETSEVEWTVGEWRKLVGRRVKEAMDLNPANKLLQTENEDSVEETRSNRNSPRLSYGSSSKSSKSSKSSRERRDRKQVQDQALIVKMTGSIHSPNCDFTAQLNVTALRTDWEHTTGKAINYSFYMMLTCLTQIMVLLRQLLHTQAQSTASRVSLLCIGWQTVLDALLCLGHIYLSLAMQPLFTAFASVAFFKLLIFCVIEMKYMALIIQARNSSNGGNTTELLRRQVAMLHLRFYVALFGAFLAFFYAGEKFRIPYHLVLYSFWVPQIVQNVITEAKRPLHHYYIYGMSLTRLVAPLYIFAEPNNFLKEVYPESPTDLYMCELLVIWIGIQTAVLIAQGKYGARFMIPARFLPPKFDYSRPIPASLLPPGTTQDLTPELPLRQGRNSDVTQPTQETQSLLSNDPVVLDRHATGVTTRNRIKGSRLNRPENTMTTETVVNDTNAHSSAHTLDCVICYNAIDVHNRRGYMLAPCDHIFHRDCLLEWMNVKMECPICRTELPSI